MNSEKKYKISQMSAMKWAEHELEAVGRIASIEDKDIQYTYAMCTVNGMLHLRKALMDLSENPIYTQERNRTLQTLDEVERVISHLIKEYGVDLNAIRTFNTRKIMGDISKFNVPVMNTTRKNTRVNVSANPMNAKPLNAKPLNAKPLNAKPLNAKPMNAKPKGLLSFLGF